MNLNYNNKQLIAIEYPGIVVNIDNMSKTLGGEKEMFSVFRNSSKRLELKFRPDDPYCKSAHGDRFNTTNLLLKVIKRTKKSKNSVPALEQTSYVVACLGVVSTSYKFKTLADFQILPVVYDESLKSNKSLIPDLIPRDLHSASWLDKSVELFIPPILFSRFDLPQNGYSEIQNRGVRKPESKGNIPDHAIGQSRKRRTGFAIFSTFENLEVIDGPHPDALIQLKSFPIEAELKKKLEEYFKERPIWTKNALVGRLKCDRARLKFALPCVAYYFSNGPWRAAWIKFGYSPRKDPASKIYQVMDLRINPNIPINDQKNKRRQVYYTLKNKLAQAPQRVATINTNCLVQGNKDKDISEDDDDHISKLLAYEYFPGYLPTFRQCFYQLCDIHLDSVQKLVHQNDGYEEFCHEKDGWCVPGTLEKCRELIINDIVKTSKESKTE